MSGTQSSTVTPGNWVLQTINGMQYMVLLPANYDPGIKYETVLYLHQLDAGTWGPEYLQSQIDAWFNTTAFRTDHPSIIVAPLLDQTSDRSGSQINWGGVSTADPAGENNAIAALRQVQAQYSTDPTRTFVTGNSMGGIGTEDMMIKYNAYTGTEGKIFAAGLALAGADYGQGYPQPNQSVVTGLKNVPFWAIHGGSDTQVPLAWDQNLYAAEQAIGGVMKFTQDNSLGHDVWDTYYTQSGANAPLSWLLSQSTGGTVTPNPTPTPTPTATPSPNNTVVMGTGGAIIDTSGNKWTITAGGQVAVNGTADTTTGGVIELAYVNGTIWQENSSKLWWGETKPNASWAPTAGTATSPLPATPAPTPTPTPTPTPGPTPTPTPAPSPNDTVLTGTTGAIIDTSGNKWTITAGGQVAINGTTDTTTRGVIELAYVNGTIWQENGSKLWWGETKPNASWAPTAGTATSPLPATPAPTPTPTPTPGPTPTPTPAPSPNNTVVTGTTNAIIDTSGNKWTITAGGQVAVNGTTDTTTRGVIELAYVNGTIWQENSSKLWWGETKPNASWAPTAGTATSPLPATPAPTPTPTPTPTPGPTPTPTPAPSPNNTVVTGTTSAIIDTSGNKWTITAGGQVAVNGTADTTTGGVIELAYVNGTIWQENSSKLWWGETKPNASWAPTAGTAISPLPTTPTPTPTPTTAVTRDPSQIPFASTSLFNLPIGSGAQWTPNAQLADSNIYINTTLSDWNQNIWIGTASDPVITVTDDGSVDGTPGRVFQAHIPAAAVPAAGRDATFAVDDTVTHTWYSFGAFQRTGATTATITQGSGESDFGSGLQDANSNWDEAVGTLRETDLQAGAINHMLRIQLPSDMLKSYSNSPYQLAPNAWPQTEEDGFAVNGNGGVPYSGTVDYGVTLGIPSTAVEPADVAANAGADILWHALRNHGAMIRDSASSDNTLTMQADQNVDGNDPLILGMEKYSPQIMAQVQILANQGPNSINGGGTPIVPLDPLPSDAPVITIAAATTSTTVSQSDLSIAATAGNHILFLSGSGDSVSLSGGTNTINDTGRLNTYLLPAAGKGTDSFTSNILNQGDTLNLKTALAATDWNGSSSTLAKYLTVTDSATAATLSISATSGGPATMIATINGATTATLSSVLAHAIT